MTAVNDFANISQPAVTVRLPVPATTSSAVINAALASSSQTAQKVFVIIQAITPILYIYFSTCL